MTALMDARAMAWVEASNRLDAAVKLRNEFRKTVPDQLMPLPPNYHALIAEAQAFATLAGVDASVGLIMGSWLEEKAESARKEHADRSAFMADLFEREQDD